MVITILMTIASTKMTIAVTPETILKRAENRLGKCAKRLCFVKEYYFYGPRDAPKHPLVPPDTSWFVRKIRKLRSEKRPLRLYIYTWSPLVLHKYTVACKVFFAVHTMTRAFASLSYTYLWIAIPCAVSCYYAANEGRLRSARQRWLPP